MSKNNIQEDLMKKFQKIISSEGEKPLDVIDIKKGATQTLKKIVKYKNKSLFIKMGEKVDIENINYDSITGNNLFLEKIVKHSSKKILTIPFYSELTLDRFILNLDPGNKFKLIMDVLDKTWNFFWNSSKQINLFKTVSTLEEYIESHTSNLFVKNNVFDFGNSVKMDLQTFYTKPIVFLKNNKKYILPSVDNMVDEVKNLILSLEPKKKYNILGDFQPNNILVKDNIFKIIDLSNMTRNGDLAQDLGKFFNYFNRFFLVADIRDKYLLKPLVNIVIKNNKNNIEVESLISNDSKYFRHIDCQIFNELEVKFAKKIYSTNQDFNIIKRIKLYKFITNLITIKRHLRYDKLISLLFFVLFDSYLEILNEVKSS